MRRLMSACSIAACLFAGSATAAEIDPQKAARYFERFQQVCEAEAGRLWGESLCGPILFVDMDTRQAVASQSDAQNALIPHGDVFTGRYPSNLPVANMGIDWNGTRWTMLVWPYLPDAENQRLALMAHEAYHRIQPALGVALSNPANTHLDGFHGRYWLRLEMRALERALASERAERRDAIGDALLFRAIRRAPMPEAADDETALERNEGMAQYTGFAVGAPAAGANPLDMARRQLVNIEQSPSFVRSFAYGTGSAYGLLLDAYGLNGWRRRALAGEGIAGLLGEAAGLPIPSLSEATTRARSYASDEVRDQEQARETDRLARLDEFRRKLVDGAVVIVPMPEGGGAFDPNRLYPLGEAGTVYGRYMAGDDWGDLDVNEMALIPPGSQSIILPGPVETGENRISGPGWTIDLKAGWSLQPGLRAGDVELKPVSN